ncbi:hypothetical protein GGX14DRAFT_447827 [Mycena pura]|uniref:Auxin efflux carrier n=1 Tax=Mycena pura TaxID=153505 RepID=A0AAD6VHI4_9AGAR|nr:hypothetical protein GGX14DRAFT_447827 [Mycena pura]
MASDLLEGIVSSAKASISVLLVLVYGYGLRKWKLISQAGETNISKLCTKFFLPALLFTEIGPLATVQNLRNYWPIIPLSLFFQGAAFAVAMLSRLVGMPQHFVPMFIFNNVTSLPLLLINALGASGSLDQLVTADRTLDSVLRTGRVYFLINALVGNLVRFAFGPYLMKSHAHEAEAEDEDFAGHIALPEEATDEPLRITTRMRRGLKRTKHWIVRAINPPLMGGILAMVFGLIPWFHRELFGSGILSPISDSINNIGKLFSALQMLVVGSHLHSKKGSRVRPLILLWLFTYRFVLAPALSISVVYYIRTAWSNLIDKDPMLLFVLCMSNVGPPALTLSAVAAMAELPSDEDSQVSRILTFSYGVTPFISFSVTAALWMIRQTETRE